MKKRFWVSADPFDESIVTAAIEAGADAVLVPEGMSTRAKRLGMIETIAADGDLRLGQDVSRVRITGKEDEAAVDGRLPTIIENEDWTIIPLENLLSKHRGNLIQTVATAEEAKLALEVMECGADGILLTARDPSEVKRTGEMVERANAERLTLVPVKIVGRKPVAMSDRCCVDTTTLLPPGVGLLVGNTASAMFLVHNENVPSPYCDARPFRVNAGAVHAYVRLPGNRTAYLSELSSGDEVLACDPEGNGRVVAIGRNKIERRPMLLVRAEDDNGRQASLVLQNAETVRLTRPDGSPASVTQLENGEGVMAAFFEPVGRHFGQPIQETISER